MSRIPLDLQAVFVASSRDIHTIKPPASRSAFKVFKHILGFRGRSKQSERSKRRESFTSATLSTSESVGQALRPHETEPSSNESLSLQEHLETLLTPRGYLPGRYPILESSYFSRPTPYQLACYNAKLIDMVKSQDEEKIRELFGVGMLSPNACNIHGETLLHRACRMGYHRVLSAFVEEGADVTICDKQGRSLLHDACWGARPSFQTFSLLVRLEPSLIFMADCRGACPLDYVRKDHREFWIDYLDRMADELWPRVLTPTAPSRFSENPHSRPIPDPENPLPLNLASMVASGRLSAAEAAILMNDEDESSVGQEDDDDSISDDDDDWSTSEDDEDNFVDESTMGDYEGIQDLLLIDMSKIQSVCALVPV